MPRQQLAAVRPARTPERLQRESEDVRLVIKARNGDSVALDALIRRYTGFVRLKASSYFIAGGESDDLIQEGLDRPLQGRPRFPHRQGDLVPQLRGALHHAPDHHGDQGRDPLQAPAAERLRLVQPDARGPGGRRLHARRRAPGPRRRRSRDLRHLHRGAPEPRLHARHRPLAARDGRASLLHGGQLVRGDGRGARLRHEDDRQRPPAGEAQGAHTPGVAPGSPVGAGYDAGAPV